MNPLLQWLPHAIMFPTVLFACDRDDVFYGGLAAGYSAGVWVSVAFHWGLFMTLFSATGAVWFAWLWWTHRRKGRWKRVARALGAKSAALVAALVRSLKPAPVPRPLRPVRSPA